MVRITSGFQVFEHKCFRCSFVIPKINDIYKSRSRTAIFDGYGYFKPNPNEKKDIGRVLKKIIFPGIYTDYAG
jgi:hypothetical protein